MLRAGNGASSRPMRCPSSWSHGRRDGDWTSPSLCAMSFWLAHIGGNPFHTGWGFALAVAGWRFYFSVLVVAVTSVKGRRELDQLRIKTLEHTQALERQIL